MFRFAKKAFILFAFLLFVPLWAYAETVSFARELQRNHRTHDYLDSQAMLEIFYQQATLQDKSLGLQQECKLSYTVSVLGNSILSPITFLDEELHPSKGVWITRFQVNRCGQEKIYSTYFIASTPSAPPQHHEYYPGASDASPLLIKDAMLSSLMAVQMVPKNKICAKINVVDMRVTEKIHDVVQMDQRHKKIWREIWTFKACDELIEVGIIFIPDDLGSGARFIITGASK